MKYTFHYAAASPLAAAHTGTYIVTLQAECRGVHRHTIILRPACRRLLISILFSDSSELGRLVPNNSTVHTGVSELQFSSVHAQ